MPFQFSGLADFILAIAALVGALVAIIRELRKMRQDIVRSVEAHMIGTAPPGSAAGAEISGPAHRRAAARGKESHS